MDGSIVGSINQRGYLFDCLALASVSVTRTPDGVSVARYVQPRRGMPHVFVLLGPYWVGRMMP